MEENEIKPVEQNDTESEATVTENKGVEQSVGGGQAATEESSQPSREEILAISRKENKNGDERDMQANQRGMGFAYSVGILICGLVYLVDVIVGREMPYELMMAYMGMTATWSIYYAIKNTKHRPLFWACGIVCAITFIFFTVFWILKLCGVVID